MNVTLPDGASIFVESPNAYLGTVRRFLREAVA